MDGTYHGFALVTPVTQTERQTEAYAGAMVTWVLERLRNFSARNGLLLLTLILYADVFATVALKMPLLDALSVEQATPRTAVLALVGLGLSPMVSSIASALLGLVVHVVWFGVGGLAHHLFPASPLVDRLDAALDEKWKWRLAARSTSDRLLKLALSGCGPALEVYNQRLLRDREAIEVANYCLAFVVMLCGSFLVGRRSVAVAVWSAVATSTTATAATLLTVVVVLMLLVPVLNVPEDPESAVAPALPPETVPPSTEPCA